MIGIQPNQNSVFIPMIQTGCMKTEFDSTYPAGLNGIISPDEFQMSINRINQQVTSKRNILKFLQILISLSTIIGVTLIVISAMKKRSKNQSHLFYPFSIAGVVIIAVGVIVYAIGVCFIQLRRTKYMRQAIAEESMKYSSRLPIPCSWRLDTIRVTNNGYRNNNTESVYHLVIDIGGSTVSYNAVYSPNQDMSFVHQQQFCTPPPPPPPYPCESVEHCLQCGAQRENLKAKFCASCGQILEK